MKAIKRILLAAVLMLLFPGCAGMTEMYRQSYCNFDGGFKKGMNDAQNGSPMDANFSYPCSDVEKKDAEKGYRKGYQAGLPSRIIVQPYEG